jgi:hypothetical protein
MAAFLKNYYPAGYIHAFLVFGQFGRLNCMFLITLFFPESDPHAQLDDVEINIKNLKMNETIMILNEMMLNEMMLNEMTLNQMK